MTTGFALASAPFSAAAKTSASACADYQELIEIELKRGRNATGIWQDLVDRHGFAGSYLSVKLFVRGLRGASSPAARIIIETRIGVECEIDYGTGSMVSDPDTGKHRQARLFVMTLGYEACQNLLGYLRSLRGHLRPG